LAFGKVATATDGVPSAVVEVEMRVDDDVDVFRGDSDSVEVVEQLGGLFVDLHEAVGKLIANAGFDEDVLLAGADEKRV